MKSHDFIRGNRSINTVDCKGLLTPFGISMSSPALADAVVECVAPQSLITQPRKPSPVSAKTKVVVCTRISLARHHGNQADCAFRCEHCHTSTHPPADRPTDRNQPTLHHSLTSTHPPADRPTDRNQPTLHHSLTHSSTH
jgi:hypothetical protein